LGYLPVHRADHPDRRLLSRDVADFGRRRALAGTPGEGSPSMSGSSAVADTAGEPLVRFDKVVKSFGSLVVLKELDLAVAAHEKVSLIGPSGSGKTTVLRALMTLEPIQSGVIYVEGEPLTHM